ncbi:DUF3467 domain-containing protein [Urbifossiella limnaea]|uniref:DUF3467 domain-containing protein n=1 Tax=Urbifossiella limnaea TaxID=2528023 RepID=A0A517XN63_9BACT|nr:DUF3467 domain-containing protein [Urbifossiella limnaea]QDU18916.1 hypothetical protein ETAA1_08120 [Urbifossiella limnaea]
MAEETPAPAPAPAAPGQAQQIQVSINDAEMASVYVNFFRVTGNPDEVLLDLGMYSQVMGAAGPEPIELSHRLVMNFVTAKKLAEVLRVVVARHEQAFGVVELDPNRRLRVQPPANR